NIAVFGWVVILTETALAVLLLSGAWVRAAAAIGAVQSLVIGLTVAAAPEEWPWSYLLMVAAHVVLLASSAGRHRAVDAVRAGRRGRGPDRPAAILAIVVGGYGIVGSLGDPLAPLGPQIGAAALEIGLGRFNTAGGAVILLVGLSLLLVDRGSAPAVLLATAAVVASVAAVSIHVQVASGEVLLGGSGTSATLLLTLALVALFQARHRKARP
ncbi:MAG: hypothetical protein ACRCY9_21700, partial [Phycicoccus sp.]